VDSAFFIDLKRRVGFDRPDAENLRSLWPVVQPVVAAMTDRFHQWLLSDPAAKAVFTGGETQVANQRRAFERWLADLFNGSYDFEYFQRRIDIGRTHVRVGMPQHYMFTAMEMVWQELQTRILQAGVPDAPASLLSLHRLLTLETAVMLESYKDVYAQRVRDEERTVAEEKLTHSEHLAQIGQLAASLAHEIKNPLAGISGAIQVLRDQMDGDDPRQPVIREILAQINRLDATMKDLLVYARPRPPEFRPCDLVAMTNRVMKLIREAASVRNVPMEVHAEAQVPPVPADLRQIEQLIMNLVLNAAHACRLGGRVDIHLSSADRKVILEVEDTGTGMTPEILARAFEPFFTTRAKGTGLGLPICRKIVEAHQGTIRMESRPGSGTQVIVELPQVWA
jgi:signal transduction histidine kinase